MKDAPNFADLVDEDDPLTEDQILKIYQGHDDLPNDERPLEPEDSDGMIHVTSTSGKVLHYWQGSQTSQLSTKLSECGASVMIDLQHVRGMQEGAFGLMRSYAAQGVRVILHKPEPEIRFKAWFKLFTISMGDGLYLLRSEMQIHSESRVHNILERKNSATWAKLQKLLRRKRGEEESEASE